MARVTVEDCLHDVENLFQLVLVSSRRARQIYMGSDPRVPEDGDKPTVIALREIAEGKVGVEVLDEKVAPSGEFGEMEQSTGIEPSAEAQTEAVPDAEASETQEAAAGPESESEDPETDPEASRQPPPSEA